MTIACPHCQSRYLLPPSLMGPGGARVRCPQCRNPFLVGADGGVTALPAAGAEPPKTQIENAAPPAPAEPRAPAVPEPAATETVTASEPETPAEVARRLLAEMDAEHGPSEIAFAAQHGTFFFAHGHRLMAAWDDYRRLAGRAASAAVFRDALRERWGVELTPAETLPR